MPIASRAVLMEHNTDPAIDLMADVKDLVAAIEVNGQDLLIAVYKRPEKTSGGLLLPDSVRDEDKYQGKIGLVVKAGPCVHCEDIDPMTGVAINDKLRIRYGTVERIPKVGDWVLFSIGETFPFLLGTTTFRLAGAHTIRGVITRPDLAF